MNIFSLKVKTYPAIYLILLLALALSFQQAIAKPEKKNTKPSQDTEKIFVQSSQAINLNALRKAIDDLRTTFGERYKSGEQFASSLAAIESKLLKITEEHNSGDSAALKHLEILQSEYSALQRRALIANPMVSGQPILFTVRKQYARDHHNTATFFPSYDSEFNTGRMRPGAAMKTVKFDPETGASTVTELINRPKGHGPRS